MQITEQLVQKVRDWLREDGIKFFREVKAEHGDLNAVWNESGIPHCVHFREGMQVRNFMRETGLCDDWSCHDFDNFWIAVVEAAIEDIEKESVKYWETDDIPKTNYGLWLARLLFWGFFLSAVILGWPWWVLLCLIMLALQVTFPDGYVSLLKSWKAWLTNNRRG